MYVLQRVVRDGNTLRFEDIPGEVHNDYRNAQSSRIYNYRKDIVVIQARDEEQPESMCIDLSKMTQAQKEEWVISSLAGILEANTRRALDTKQAIQIILQEGCRISRG